MFVKISLNFVILKIMMFRHSKFKLAKLKFPILKMNSITISNKESVKNKVTKTISSINISITNIKTVIQFIRTNSPILFLNKRNTIKIKLNKYLKVL